MDASLHADRTGETGTGASIGTAGGTTDSGDNTPGSGLGGTESTGGGGGGGGGSTGSGGTGALGTDTDGGNSGGASAGSTRSDAGVGGASGFGGNGKDAGVSDGSSAGGTRVDGSLAHDDASVEDAALRTCSWKNGPPTLGTPESIGSPNSSLDEENPVLSPDGLTLYYSRKVGSRARDVYFATRPTQSGSFGDGTEITSVSTAADESHFFVGPSGLEAYVVSNRSGAVGGLDVFRSTRTTTTAPFAGFTSLANVNSIRDDFDPYLESDGRTLWLAPEDSSGTQHIVYATRADANTPFGTPIAASTLNSSSGLESNLSLTEDALVIAFVSTRDGSYRLYYAVRSTRGATFGPPSVVPAMDPYISSISDAFIAPNGCEIYFVQAGAGGRDIYVAHATP